MTILESFPQHAPADRLDGQSASVTATAPGGQDDSQGWFPLSQGQRSRWLLYQLDPKCQGRHNNAFAFNVHGALDLVQLDRTVQALVQRHPMLRARIRSHGSEPEQQIVDNGPSALKVIDVGAGDDLAARVWADATRPFDLSAPPLIRVHVYPLGDQRSVVLLAFDHLVGDGWSFWRMFDELDQQLAQSVEVPTAPAMDYRAFVQHQRTWLNGPAAQRQRTYWQAELEAPLPLLQLPTDRTDRNAAPYEIGVTSLYLPPELDDRLRDAARRRGGSLYTALLTAYVAVLHRHTGQRDLVIGSPMPGRTDVAWQGVVGDFVNAVPIRCRLEEQTTLADLHAMVRAKTLRGLRHQEYPLNLLVDSLGAAAPLRNGVRSLFDTMFLFQNARHASGLGSLWNEHGGGRARWGGHDISAFQLHQSGNIDLDLTLEALEAGDAVRCDFRYDARKFSVASIERMVQHFQRVLEALADDDQQLVDRVDLLAESERAQLARWSQGPALALPNDALIHRLFERRAVQQPAAVAVEFEGETLSYAALNQAANRVAHGLLAQGVQPDDRVVVCAQRGFEMVIALLGVMKAGAAYVPLEPTQPAQRLLQMLEDAAPAAVLSHGAVRSMPAVALALDKMAAGGVPVHCVGEAFADVPDYDPLLPSLRPDHLAYVIFTSGSTGRPKGAMNAHRAVVNRLVWGLQIFALTPQDRVLQKTPFGFDVSVWEFFMPLLAGARLVMARPEGHQDPHYLAQAIERHGITVLHFVPSMLQAFLDAVPAGGGASLRLIKCSGEALPPVLANRARQAWPQAGLHNLYGPTETAVEVSVWSAGEGAVDLVPIGRPIANTRLHILDAFNQPTPIGVPGELHIGGLPVGRGYLNRPELTAERFVADPFTDDPKARLYRTGDLARWLPDGQVEYLGRNDFQVKVRGFRIELAEIETALRHCVGVSDAAVLAREDRPGEQRLVAYVRGDDGVVLEPASLRLRLAQALPDYMVPVAFVALDRFPLTPSGKLDRKALPAPDEGAFASRAYEAPQGEIEAGVAAVWASLLEVTRVGRQDDFFQLGGHSLLAVQLTSRLRERLGVEVPLSQVFAHPVLADFAAQLAQTGVTTMAAIERADRTRPLPLSWAQQRLWFLDQLDAGAGAAYHMPAALRLRGALDRAALRATLDHVVARHESLRTTFVLDNGEPAQRIADEGVGFALIEQDLSALDEASQRREVDSISAEFFSQPFDLARGPLIHGRLLALTPTEHVLLITQHHIISDGWSVGVLVREVGTLYEAYSQGRADPLPALSLQYADYAAWQRQWLQGDRLQVQLDHWKSHLTGAPELLDLPLDRPRPAVQGHAGGTVPISLPGELVASLEALARRHDLTLFMVLLAGWSTLLARVSGQATVVVGTPVANRPQLAVEPLIGFFVNTLALRVEIESDATVAQLLAQVRNTTLAALAHQDAPFERVVEAVQPRRSRSHHPVFQAMFALNTAPTAQDLALTGLQLALLPQATTTTRCDVTLALNVSDGSVAGGLDYAADLFDHATIERLSRSLVTLLRALCVDDAASLDGLPLLSDADRRQALAGASGPTLDIERDSFVHGLIERQAARQPDAIALACRDQTLAYGEMNRRANRLAHRLQAAGVQPGHLVGLCAERSIDLVVGVLGILKAGAAYVPLDPSYPVQRLTRMLADSAPVVLVAEFELLAQRGLTPPCPVVAIDEGVDAWAFASDLDADPDPAMLGLSTQHPAYVIYTSGSTGDAKGVVIEHHALSASNAARVARYAARETFLLVPSFAFDSSVAVLFWALSAGARLVIADSDEARDPVRLAALVERHGVDLWLSVPSLYDATLSVAREGQLASLRTVIVAGEALQEGVLRRHREQLGAVAALYNEYGPTEAAVWCTVAEVDDLSFCDIGRPIANAQILVLDTSLRLVPLGVVGEICVGGAGLARGYLGRSELTAERFVEGPRDSAQMQRLYRTGDLGRWRADGRLEYLGRVDFQVKLRGFRIELGEIESQLTRCDGVAEAAVLAREDRPGEQRLVAYLRAGDGELLEPAALRAHLAQALPDYMVPAAFVVLPSFPLTPNGKLDRKALPAPDESALASREYEAPQGDAERAVAEVWQGLLGVARIGRHDDFFLLGGHSLLAVQLTSRLRERLGVEVALSEVFAHPVLADFAAQLAQVGATPMEAISLADRTQPLPLSWAQQRLWFLDQLDAAAGAAYHMPAALRLSGALDRAALRATLDGVVARHESLRTTFVLDNGEPVQRIADEGVGFALIEQDLSALDEATQRREVERVSEEFFSQPFDLARGPLIRGRLLALTPTEHVLLITQHHIISDGWSIGVLVREVGALYEAHSQGRADPLPALTLQYADYAAWQRQWLQGERLQAQLDYWKAHLSGAPELLDLPLDRPRPAVQGYAGASVELHLPAELMQGLKALGQRHGATLFMTLLAGWATLLSRLSGQADVVIGTPVANRPRREVEGLIGFFVNTLAIRLSLVSEPTVASLLAQVKARTLGAYAHQDLPFEQVVEALNPTRSQSHSPLFQTMLTMNDVGMSGELRLPDIVLEPLPPARGSTHFDLHLTLVEVDDGFDGELSWRTDLFDAATVQRWLGSLRMILAAMVEDDQRAIRQLPLLDDAARAAMLALAQGPREARDECTILQAFEAQAAAQPDAPAIVADGRCLSFGELNRRANGVARALIAMGIGPDDRVLLCLERSLEMAIGWLGILKAGAAYVPVEPDQPHERLATVFADCGATVLLTQGALAGRLPAGTLRVLALDDETLWPESEANPVPATLSAQHLAYVIYTSGSTGTPKGVMVEHRSALNFWRVMQASTHAALERGAQVALNASFAFDMSLKGWLQLLSGHCVHVIPQAIRADGAALMSYLQSHRIDAVDSTPSQLAVLLEAGLLDPAQAHVPTVVVLGGEAIPESMWQRLRGASHIRFFNMYGPTECTVDATIGRIEPGDERPHIGRPIANSRVYLLDEALAPVPPGLPGDLYIGGLGVARGYLGRPELTAERFIDDPFEPGARMYRTGDVGRWLPGGEIAYIGRSDFQVKLRGFRIELGEIESVLRTHPQVGDGLVMPRNHPSGSTGLVAYVIPRPHMNVVVTDLRNHLAARLPDYMVPSAFVLIERFPLNANGKTDRQALPEPDAEAFVHGLYEAPQGELEQTLAGLWQELLGLEQIGRHDDFFALGGHSLLAVQLIARIRDLLQVEVNLTDLFADSSLKNLAEVVAATTRETFAAIAPVSRDGALPLSLAQQRLWFLDALDPAASAAYRYDIAVRIDGALDVPALQRTLDALVRRHESLRTVFVPAGKEPVQVIGAADAGLPLRLHDLTALPESERKARLAAIRDEELAERFDLATGPLIRARLCLLAEQHAVLLLTLHHIVTDHWSNERLVQEVNTLYAAFQQGLADPLAPLTIQYADYAAWQRDRLRGAVVEAQIDWWKQHLEGAPSLLELPADRARPATQSFAGGRVEFTLPEGLSRGLRQLSQRHGATLFMTLMAAWSTFLARLSGQSDIVIGTPVANRATREVEGLIGFFVNTLALRVRVDEAISVADLLAQVKRDAVAAFERQDVPFEQVVEALNPSRHLAYSPVFQTMLTLHQSAPGDAFQMPGTHWALMDSMQTASHFDLSLAVTEAGSGMAAVLEYSSDLFDDSTVRRWATHFETLLASMVADEQQAVGALALLSADEAHQLTHEFNDRNTRLGNSPRDRLVHQLFEEQVAQQPDAVAVVDGDRRLSFAEVNRRANRLAHYLLAQGVQAEDRVAVSAERSAELILALLGILKAGAAYLPIDPAVPQERQAFMLADAEARLLLTQSHLQERLPQTVPVALLDDPALTQDLPEHDPAIAMTSDRLAYVIYTSGSTGQAKGVMVTHRNVVHLNVGQPFIDFSPKHRLAYCANPAFDASTWEIWGTLLNGARLVVVPMDVLLEPARLSELLEREQVTILQLIAGLLKRYAQPMAQAFAKLQVLLFGGDQSELATVLSIWRSAPACRLIHAYGPTETTTFSTEYIVGEHTQNERTLPIGRAIADSQLYVLDARGNPVPPGVEGEIYIGGEGVTRGYLKRPELTAERFVEDRFSGKPGARLYRTGDLGRVRLDGNLEFLGRNDSQVKLRGYRVELGEIELRLAQCAGVDQAFVMVRVDAAGEKRLVAYLTSTEPVDAGALRAELGRHLPEYMVPAAFVRMDAIPVTANGKVDRRALPEPDETATAARAYAAPQGEIEAALAEIWQQLLQVPRVGRDDHFFELGGHSLMAVQLVARIREQFSVELPLKNLFAGPVLRRVADEITTLQLALYDAQDRQALERELATLSEAELLALLNGVN